VNRAMIPDFDPELLIATAQRHRLGLNLTLFRLANGERWGDPVNITRCGRISRFLSPKNGGRSIPYDPRRGYALLQFAEIYSQIKAYNGRTDLFKVTDAEGSFFTIVDVTTHATGRTPVWMEAQYGASSRSHSARDLARIERAFKEAGLTYVVFNEMNFGLEIRRNVHAIFKSRMIEVSGRQQLDVIEHVQGGGATIGSCAARLSEHERPEDMVYALIARGRLEIAINQPLLAETPVFLPGAPFWMKARHGNRGAYANVGKAGQKVKDG
jgi:hypothetical protein